ncbi:hypothetical protein [Corynebacterium auriscanis]|uniref:hypothetical protein n=1 Tax=Corynebacterium auriscanis TaxID=99807 RepID=UPI000A6F1738|nr:hypothetical protein [Corynebacterium auriscanis]
MAKGRDEGNGWAPDSLPALGWVPLDSGEAGEESEGFPGDGEVECVGDAPEGEPAA